MGSLIQLLGIPKRSEWRQRLHGLAPQMIVVLFLLLVASAVGVSIILLPSFLRVQFIFLIALILIMLWRNEPFDLLITFSLIAIFANGGTLPTRDIVFEPVEYIGYLVFLMFVFYRLAEGKQIWQRTPLDLPIFLFVLVIAANLIYSLWMGNLFTNVLREALMYPRFILIYYMTVNVLNTREKLDFYLQMGLIILVFMAFYGGYQYFFGGLEALKGYGVGGRVFTTFGNANLYAGFLELTVPILFSFVISNRNLRYRFLLAILCGVLFLNAVLTFSRGAMGSIIASLMILTVLRSRQRIIILLLLLLLIIILATTTNLLSRQLALVLALPRCGLNTLLFTG